MPYAKRDVLPGYPKVFVFETRAEIDQYLAGERVTCLLCGREFRLLDTHLRNVHKVTSDDYREMYGLPYLRGLCGSSFSERRSEHGKAIWSENEERQAAALKTARAVQAATGTNPQRAKPQFWRAERTGDLATRRKLTAAQVATIKARRAAGDTLSTLAELFRVSPANIQSIVTGKTWAAIAPAVTTP